MLWTRMDLFDLPPAKTMPNDGVCHLVTVIKTSVLLPNHFVKLLQLIRKFGNNESKNNAYINALKALC